IETGIGGLDVQIGKRRFDAHVVILLLCSVLPVSTKGSSSLAAEEVPAGRRQRTTITDTFECEAM
ncbi:MAG: hypothetical protein KDH19_08250, partial [Geminicoccaceae bacterium]|nr:hypothetical protein [Geminicoccaceae bacterium]